MAQKSSTACREYASRSCRGDHPCLPDSVCRANRCALCGCSELTAADALSVFDKVSAATPASPAKADQQSPPAPAGAAAGTHAAVGTADSGGNRPAGLGSQQRQSTFMRCVTQQLLQRLEAGTGSDTVLTAGTQQADSAAAAAGTGAACDDAAAPCSSGSEGAHSPTGSKSTASRSGQCSDAGPDERRPVSQDSIDGNTSRPSSDGGSDAAAGQDDEQCTGAGKAAEAMPAPALMCAAGGSSGGARHAVLTAIQFLQAMVLLSRRCFPRIANASRAWQLLLERHVQPLADRKRSR